MFKYQLLFVVKYKLKRQLPHYTLKRQRFNNSLRQQVASCKTPQTNPSLTIAPVKCLRLLNFSVSAVSSTTISGPTRCVSLFHLQRYPFPSSFFFLLYMSTHSINQTGFPHASGTMGLCLHFQREGEGDSNRFFSGFAFLYSKHYQM